MGRPKGKGKGNGVSKGKGKGKAVETPKGKALETSKGKAPETSKGKAPEIPKCNAIDEYDEAQTGPNEEAIQQDEAGQQEGSSQQEQSSRQDGSSQQEGPSQEERVDWRGRVFAFADKEVARLEGECKAKVEELMTTYQRNTGAEGRFRVDFRRHPNAEYHFPRVFPAIDVYVDFEMELFEERQIRYLVHETVLPLLHSPAARVHFHPLEGYVPPVKWTPRRQVAKH